jgi:Co/Zn/Cd efflux system component
MADLAPRPDHPASEEYPGTREDHHHGDDAAVHHLGGPHGHTHGLLDPGIVTTARGIWAVKWSFVGLVVTAVLQLGIVALSGSVALLADTIHNFGDAATAIPLWIASRARGCGPAAASRMATGASRIWPAPPSS